MIDKPYCSGTLSKAGFFGLIRSALRRLSMRWKPKNEYLKSVRRMCTNTGRSKFEYLCESCYNWFTKKSIEVDHKVPCGSLKDFDDIGPFVKKLLCEKDGYRILCKACHAAKTNKERKCKVKNEVS